MLDRLLPLSLTDTARALNVHPFEVVRLAVLADRVPADAWLLDEEDVASLREFGGIEDDWWEGAQLPEDTNPRRRRLRGLMARLLERDVVGENLTRMDNLQRGLSAEDSAFVAKTVAHLTNAGVLAMVACPAGKLLSIQPSHRKEAEQLARTGAGLAGIKSLVGGD